MKRNRNVLIWLGILIVTAGLWFFAARTRLHLVDPLSFIVVVAVAAAILTGLFWWGLRDTGDAPRDVTDKSNS